MTCLIWIHPAFGERAQGLARLAEQLLHNALGPYPNLHRTALNLTPVPGGVAAGCRCRLIVDGAWVKAVVTADHANPSHAFLRVARQAVQLLADGDGGSATAA